LFRFYTVAAGPTAVGSDWLFFGQRSTSLLAFVLSILISLQDNLIIIIVYGIEVRVLLLPNEI
jgi:hypothetical protein